jgi:hypothetical protein
MIMLALDLDTRWKAGSDARNIFIVVLRTVEMLKCDAIWYFTGNKRISIVLTDFSFVVPVQVTSLQFWVAIAAEGGSSNSLIVADGGFVSVVIVADDQTVHEGRT